MKKNGDFYSDGSYVLRAPVAEEVAGVTHIQSGFHVCQARDEATAIELAKILTAQWHEERDRNNGVIDGGRDELGRRWTAFKSRGVWFVDVDGFTFGMDEGPFGGLHRGDDIARFEMLKKLAEFQACQT